MWNKLSYFNKITRNHDIQSVIPSSILNRFPIGLWLWIGMAIEKNNIKNIIMNLIRKKLASAFDSMQNGRFSRFPKPIKYSSERTFSWSTANFPWKKVYFNSLNWGEVLSKKNKKKKKARESIIYLFYQNDVKFRCPSFGIYRLILTTEGDIHE